MNLAQMCMISIADRFWKMTYSKELIRRCSLEKLSLESVEVIAEVRRHIDDLILPVPLKKELQVITLRMGVQLVAWRPYSRYELRVGLQSFYKCIDHVHWDNNGIIEEVRTAEALYKAGLLRICHRNWRIICDYCLEECIIDFWMKLVTDSDQRRRQCICKTAKRECMIYLYWVLRMENNLEQFPLLARGYDDRRTLDENMLQYSYTHGPSATMYFQKRVDENVRKNS
uniref:Uncharacterized protein n=1 Tax=Bracon brevicornis TaxID=1563983 RepID=A0A6V7ITU4_9HYME